MTVRSCQSQAASPNTFHAQPKEESNPRANGQNVPQRRAQIKAPQNLQTKRLRTGKIGNGQISVVLTDGNY